MILSGLETFFGRRESLHTHSVDHYRSWGWGFVIPGWELGIGEAVLRLKEGKKRHSNVNVPFCKGKKITRSTYKKMYT